jgi:hypothetical protein
VHHDDCAVSPTIGWSLPQQPPACLVDDARPSVVDAFLLARVTLSIIGARGVHRRDQREYDKTQPQHLGAPFERIPDPP